MEDPSSGVPDPAASAPAPLEPAALVAHRLHFSGSGSEYFRIWIVNLALTIVTLGIYSAWAKVRKLRYLYGSTSLDGSAFGYHGEPLKILKGRAIALVLFAGYSLAGRVSPYAALAAFVVLLVAIPWLVVKSLSFRLRMTSWRALRCSFQQDFRGAYRVFLGWMLASALTLGLLLPRFLWERQRFVVDRASIGSTPFHFGARVWPFYRTLLIAGVSGLAILIGVVAATMFALGPRPADQSAQLILSLVPLLAIGLVYVCLAGYVQARLMNAVYNTTTVGPHRLHSQLGARRLTWIYLSNLVGILLTAGLFVPWAQVRLARYRAGTMEVLAYGSLADFAADQAAVRPGAAGEEISEFFDVDFGL